MLGIDFGFGKNNFLIFIVTLSLIVIIIIIITIIIIIIIDIMANTPCGQWKMILSDLNHWNCATTVVSSSGKERDRQSWLIVRLVLYGAYMTHAACNGWILMVSALPINPIVVYLVCASIVPSLVLHA